MTNTVVIAPRLLKSKETAAYLAISARKLWSMSKAGTIPTVHIGRRAIRYDKADLDDFIQRAKDQGAAS